MEKISKGGAKVEYPVQIPLVKDLSYEGELASNKAICMSLLWKHFVWSLLTDKDHNFQRNVEGYMRKLDSSDVRSLEELVDFIKAHADQELPAGRRNRCFLT